jgi:hypothetical protein
LRAQAANGFKRHAERLRRHFRGGEAAEAALAAAHAATCDRLETVDLDWSEVCVDRCAQLAGRDALAAANHNFVIEIVDRAGRPGKSAGKTALKTAKPRDLAPRAAAVDPR